MGIKITQECDGCDKKRTIKTEVDGETAGWIKANQGHPGIIPNKYLCPQCIDKALKRGLND